MKKDSLIQGNIGKALLLFVLPLIAGSLIQQLYTTVDAVIVGQFTGKSGLAAIDSVHTLFKFPINFMNGLAAGTTILISGYFGAKDTKKLQETVNAALRIALLLGLVCTLAGIIGSAWLLEVMSVPDEIRNAALTYSRIYFAGLWAMILYNMNAGILRAFGDSKGPFYVLILSCIVNVFGDLLLVGVLHTGVAGAAAATVFAQIVSAAATYRLLKKSVFLEEKPRLLGGRISMLSIEKIIKTGFPLALQSMLFPIANTIVQASVNTMGTNSIAAWGICDKLDLLIWLIADAMGPALTTYTAQNIGAGKHDRVKKGVWIGTGLSVLAVAAISLLLYFGAGTAGAWFINPQDGPELIPLIRRYMQMMAPFFVFYAVAEACSGACCGMGETVFPMITTLLTICLFRVVCIFLILPKFGTMECIIWIYIASWILSGMAFVILYAVRSKRQEKQLRL